MRRSHSLGVPATGVTDHLRDNGYGAATSDTPIPALRASTLSKAAEAGNITSRCAVVGCTRVQPELYRADPVSPSRRTNARVPSGQGLASFGPADCGSLGQVEIFGPPALPAPTGYLIILEEPGVHVVATRLQLTVDGDVVLCSAGGLAHVDSAGEGG
jgi:hypothetical protein